MRHERLVKGYNLWRDTLQSMESRFWSKVDKNNIKECWGWTASLNNKGYGQFYTGKTMMTAHRTSWMLTNGNIPKGLNVLHKCDNPLCVNPEHLFLGTLSDNMQDCRDKGRLVMPNTKGCNHGRSRLTSSDVKEIRDLASVMYQREISGIYGISRGAIGRIIRRELWTHI